MVWVEALAPQMNDAIDRVGGLLPGSLTLGINELVRWYKDLPGENHALADGMLTPAKWRELLEGLEEASRKLERLGVVPMGENGLDHRTDLLGAIADSLVLMAYGSDDELAYRASSTEIYGLLVAARDDGAWSSFDPNPRALPAYEGIRQVSSSQTLDEILAFLRQANHTTDVYYDLKPDGRELVATEVSAAVTCLKDGVVSMRKLAAVDPETEIPTPAGQPSTTLRSLMASLHRVNRSLTLAISADSDRRKQAISVEELRDRT